MTVAAEILFTAPIAGAGGVCPHGEVDPSCCVDCIEEPAGPVRWDRVGDPFNARYSQDCAGCGRTVRTHDRVQRWDRTGPNPLSVYTHTDCRP